MWIKFYLETQDRTQGSRWSPYLVSTFMTHVRRSYHCYWDQNKTGHITSRTAHNYEGIHNTQWQTLLYWFRCSLVLERRLSCSLVLERRLKTQLKITQIVTIVQMKTATKGWNPPQIFCLSTFAECNCAFRIILWGTINS